MSGGLIKPPATIWVVGHTIAGKHKNPKVAGFEVVPYVAAPTSRGAATGISLVKYFRML